MVDLRAWLTSSFTDADEQMLYERAQILVQPKVGIYSLALATP